MSGWNDVTLYECMCEFMFADTFVSFDTLKNTHTQKYPSKQEVSFVENIQTVF